jgi:hypothetical protein
MKRNITDGTGFSLKWTQYWVATAEELLNDINHKTPNCGWSNNCEWFDASNATKLIVIALSTWDMWPWFSTPDDPVHMSANIPSLVTQLSDAVHGIKQRPGYDPERDVLLFRLPISQGCNTAASTGKCNATSGEDPVNKLVEFEYHLMKRVFLEQHPDVGLLDVWSWTKDVVGRTPCAVADHTGTHFGKDEARFAYVQQILHATKLLACDKPAWGLEE